MWAAFLAWVVTQSAVPTIKNEPEIANGVDLLVSGSACCAFIVWYLERSRNQTEEEARALMEAHARALRETAAVTYAVAFADGADEERSNHQADDGIGNVVSLHQHRSDDGHTAPRHTGNDNTR